jgi:hypothetical protein
MQVLQSLHVSGCDNPLIGDHFNRAVCQWDGEGGDLDGGDTLLAVQSNPMRGGWRQVDDASSNVRTTILDGHYSTSARVEIGHPGHRS